MTNRTDVTRTDRTLDFLRRGYAFSDAWRRELGAVEAPGRIVIDQGGHVGRPGTLIVDIPAAGGIVVSGDAVRL